MVSKYYKASLKKSFGNAVFPLIFMLPILILIAVNVIAAGNSYQQYRFHMNSHFTRMTNTISCYDNSFYPVIYPLSAQYDEELSTRESPFYNAGTTPMVYFYKNAEAIETSYFTPDNLIVGELPDRDNFQELQKEGRFPICISYDTAVEAGSWVGDDLDMILPDEDGITYHFRITGILYPDGNKGRVSSDGNQLPPLACAFIDEQALPDLISLGGGLYCNFLNENRILNGQTYSITMEEMLASIRSEVDEAQLTATLAASGFIVIVMSFITYNLLKFKIKGDTRILHTMGMHTGGILAIHFLRSITALFAAVVLSMLFIRLIYLPYIVNKYFDFVFVSAIGLTEFLLGLVTCGVTAFIIRRK